MTFLLFVLFLKGAMVSSSIIYFDRPMEFQFPVSKESSKNQRTMRQTVSYYKYQSVGLRRPSGRFYLDFISKRDIYIYSIYFCIRNDSFLDDRKREREWNQSEQEHQQRRTSQIINIGLDATSRLRLHCVQLQSARSPIILV